jgi:serine/threonine protein kinase
VVTRILAGARHIHVAGALDVWALGVMVYELLTGQSAFGLFVKNKDQVRDVLEFLLRGTCIDSARGKACRLHIDGFSGASLFHAFYQDVCSSAKETTGIFYDLLDMCITSTEIGGEERS